LGFDACGISKADFLPKHAKKFRQWLDKGFQAEMSYMGNNKSKREDPQLLFENAKSVITLVFNYFPQKLLPEEDNYKISKYAYGRDYHKVLKKKLKNLIESIQGHIPEFNARAFVDSAPVLERAWAEKAGLGWIGKNNMLILKKRGSFFFICEIICKHELNYNNETISEACGTCTKCIDACPTNALKPYELDARRCISYLTIENKGIIPIEYKDKLEDWIFGCDICQDVCPWNRFAKPHQEHDFLPNPDLFSLRKRDWNNLNHDQFEECFFGTPVKRAKFEGLKRNIEFVKMPANKFQKPKTINNN